MKAIRIPSDDAQQIEVVEWQTLADLQSLVGGYIETIPFVQGVAPYFDEEGKLKGRPLNRRATILMWQHHLPRTDAIVGDLVLCGQDERTGESEDVPDTWVRALVPKEG